MTTHDHVGHFTVFRGRGTPELQSVELEPIRGTPPSMIPPAADRVPLREIMTRDLVCARPDLEIGQVVGLFMKYHVGCIPVVDERRHPIGIITKFDLVEQLDAAMRSACEGCPLPSDVAARIADDVMMPIALTLDEHATVAHAAAMMTSEDTHHVLVVDREGVLVGIVSAKDIVAWIAANEILSAARSDALDE